ncbi:non-specific serine/threonine protein kinase [Rhodococcus jostii]|uniref:Non-specific serine/threonine protein kinase n=2 Tax=Rhodococcus jostii TaxID=132919 RepID=A0A1H4IVT7_RHOJO|nr:non-specific serine/threonine protein kinase [Rhodococcus jostii]
MRPSATAELEAAGFEDADEIGRGGFGVVYRCCQSALDRTVAVKVLTADLDEENRERFFREQRAMGRLTGHPNIANVLQVGATDSGRPFIVMQYYAQDSLDARIRHHGPLTLEDTLRLGVKLAGALATAHRLGILHRDVKPANILLTDYSEPALTDFGLTHFAGGFETSSGTVTGSPAFTAPEVLAGESPSTASDIYGLGATLFCAITGHAAFERRSGEQLVAQFVRITTQTVPDLREQGIADDLCAVVERAMSGHPKDRQSSTEALGEELRDVQRRHRFPVDEMALHAEPEMERHHRTLGSQQRRPGTGPDGTKGNIPLELTSFIGRRRELAETRNLLTAARLVTLTGIGGVGKTRLALRVATAAQRDFADGVWLVQLGELTDGSLLVNVVAAALGMRKSARQPEEILLEFLSAREVLLILDNCEQVVDAVAELSETLLQACPRLRILATSREAFGIGGEAVLRVPPLTVPEPDREPSLRGLPRYDAVTLFAERATSVVSTFELTDDNRIAVARICHRLDGLPLPIELAAARLRAMSPEQILQRLTDSYALLTHGSRRAPTRQQTLRLCIDWSHELCTPQEQLVWSRLSVFAGTVELDAAEQVCSEGSAPEDLLDTLTSLIEKSILIREEQGAVVRFRLLETLRDYGREKAQQSGEYPELRRRHRDWYQQLALDAETEWISSRQLEWIARIDREQPNLRDALEYCVSESPGVGLRIAASLYFFWTARGLYSEGRRWLDRLLARQSGQPIVDRVKALYAASSLAESQGDLEAAAARVEEGRALTAGTADSVAKAFVVYADGLLAFYNGEPARACSLLEESLAAFRRQDDVALQVEALTMLGLPYELLGHTERAVECYEQVLAITESCGESVYRSYALWAMAVLLWRQGNLTRARELMNQCLVRIARLVDDPVGSAMCLESLAWIAGGEDDAQRAAILMGAAEALGNVAGSSPTFLPHLLFYHDDCVQTSRRVLGENAFATAWREGNELALDAAVAYALGEQASNATSPTIAATKLTKREQEVALLVTEGLTNRAIAARLVISQRTAQGHVEHVLTKLGFTSRAQIAAWVVEQKNQS